MSNIESNKEIIEKLMRVNNHWDNAGNNCIRYLSDAIDRGAKGVHYDVISCKTKKAYLDVSKIYKKIHSNGGSIVKTWKVEKTKNMLMGSAITIGAYVAYENRDKIKNLFKKRKTNEFED